MIPVKKVEMITKIVTDVEYVMMFSVFVNMGATTVVCEFSLPETVLL